MADDNDTVGYKRPPKSGRFKPGRSGNPHGRRKKVSSFKSDLAAELQEKLPVVENGRQRKVTKQQAFCKTLVAAAIKKDIRAVNALLACMRLFGVGAEEPVAENVDLGDLDFLETYLAQQRKQNERSRRTAADGGPTKPAARKRG